MAGTHLTTVKLHWKVAGGRKTLQKNVYEESANYFSLCCSGAHAHELSKKFHKRQLLIFATAAKPFLRHFDFKASTSTVYCYAQ